MKDINNSEIQFEAPVATTIINSNTNSVICNFPIDSSTVDEYDAEHEDSQSIHQFSNNLRLWAVHHNIRQSAIRSLLVIINNDFPLAKLSTDPRTLMQTPRMNKSSQIVAIKGGTYWHQGLEICLRNCFTKLRHPLSVSINVNIDGLPLYSSSQVQFWPILFNIHNMSHIKPMVIGMFYGKSKPKSIEEFLSQFVNEMLKIYEHGIIINGNRLFVKIRCIICDSPARAFIKGINSIGFIIY